MTKSELKTGHVVTYRNGWKRTVLLNTDNTHKDYVSDGRLWGELDAFNEDLTNTFTKHYDIIKVERGHDCTQILQDPETRTDLETIWEREQVKQMTVAEIEAILGYKIEIVNEKQKEVAS